MAQGFPRPGDCEKCMRKYVRRSARSKYCEECAPVATRARKRKNYLKTTGKDRTRRNYNEQADRDNEIEIPYLEYDPDMPDPCEGCAFDGYCRMEVKAGKEVVCFPAHKNHGLYKDYK